MTSLLNDTFPADEGDTVASYYVPARGVYGEVIFRGYVSRAEMVKYVLVEAGLPVQFLGFGELSSADPGLEAVSLLDPEALDEAFAKWAEVRQAAQEKS